MPKYIVERELGQLADEQLHAAAEALTQTRQVDFPEIDWEHSHVVRAGGGLMAFCVYWAPDSDSIEQYAAAAGIPADRVHEIHVDLAPGELG